MDGEHFYGKLVGKYSSSHGCVMGIYGPSVAGGSKTTRPFGTRNQSLPGKLNQPGSPLGGSSQLLSG